MIQMIGDWIAGLKIDLFTVCCMLGIVGILWLILTSIFYRLLMKTGWWFRRQNHKQRARYKDYRPSRQR